MLSYFKYLSIASLILVLAGAFVAGVFFRSSVAGSVVQEPLVVGQQGVVKNYTKQVLCRYLPTLPNLATQKLSELNDNRNFQSLVRNSQLLLSTQPAIKVNIRGDQGGIVFSSNDYETVFFERVAPIEEYRGQVSINKAFSRIVENMGYYGELGVMHKDKVVMQILSPIDTAHCQSQSPVLAEIKGKLYYEALYDVTEPWQDLGSFQIYIAIGVVITFIVMFVVLHLTSRRTEKIINKQHEENLALEKAKMVAEAQNKEKSMFLANVSHELRTPLNAIIGFSEIIKDETMGAIGNDQYKEYINDINASGVHLLSLINDILDYSKAEARKLEVESVDVDLTKVAQSSMRLVEPRAKDAKVNLKSELPPKHILLTADPKRLKQVILNLLSNSVKFTPEGGEVVLQVKDNPLENLVTIIVKDTGIGISAKDISKAMSPFGQVDSALSRKYEGTGLGLPLTKKLTEIMGGKFDIQSEQGLGTTITLTFPMTQMKKTKNENGF